MIANTEYLFRVELYGFTERERMVFSSMFKLSEMRSRTYQEWDGSTSNQPDCLLIDGNAENVRMRIDREIALATPYPIIQIGGEIPKELNAAAHLPRPVRWAELLVTLDNVFRSRLRIESDHIAADNTPLPPEASEIQNELELQQVEQWFDRSNTLVFKTDPAVLVVDPDEKMGPYISAKLSGMRYRVDYVSSGDKAFDLLEMNRYNAVFVEINLPDINGYEICKYLKKREDRRRTASIILASKTTPIERVRANLAGCDAFLAKPIDPDKLIKILEKFLPDWQINEKAQV